MYGSNVEDSYMMLTIGFAVMSTLIQCLFVFMIVTVNHFEMLNSFQLKIAFVIVKIRPSFAVVIAKSALQSLLEVPSVNLLWLSTWLCFVTLHVVWLLGI